MKTTSTPTRGSSTAAEFGARPSDAALRRALRAGETWLEEILAHAEKRTSLTPAAGCRLLTGFWLCACADSRASADRRARDRARRVTSALSRRISANDWDAVPLSLRLVAATVLERSGVRHPALHGPTGCVSQVRAALASAHPSSMNGSTSAQIARLLVDPDATAARLRLPLGDVLAHAASISLAAASTEVDKLAAAADAHVVVGCLPPADRRAAHPVARLLAGFAVAAFRSYDFVRGCTLLRSAHRWGARGRLPPAALGFVLFHQRPEGAFGFFGTEELALQARAKRERRPLSPELALGLPVTVECLWTLVEVGCGIRVLHRLRPSGTRGGNRSPL